MIVKYYRLKEKKNMMDLSSFPKGQLLIVIKTEEEKMFMETVELSKSIPDIKKFFWVNMDEVDFVEEKEEQWSPERSSQIEKIVNEKWLDL